MNKSWIPTALLVGAIIVPIVFGWFDVNRLECTFCFRDVLVQSLAPVGYFALVGALYSLTKPSDQRGTTLARFILLGAFFGSMSFIMTYRPLWL